MSGAMLHSALAYAGRGWPVFPVHTPTATGCSCSRPVCSDVGKHPRTKNGLDDATTDAATIQEWWTKWPNANIGLLTGPDSGLLVIDLDNKPNVNGEQNFAALADGAGGVNSTLMAITGRGKHLFFEHPGLKIKNSVAQIAAGVDVRAARGFVVAAPSLHASGNRYAWANPDQPVASTPEWLLERLDGCAEQGVVKVSAGSPDVNAAAPIHEGTRNNKLFKLGCSLRGQLGLPDTDIAERLLMVNECSCVPPLPEDEVLKIAESVCRYPPETGPAKSQKRMERNPVYWYKFNVRDFYADQSVQMMTDYQLGWYTRLRASAWQNGGFLPADEDGLWRLAGAESKKVFHRDCALVLQDYEPVSICGRDRLLNRAMALEYVETLDKWMKERAAGEANRDRLRAEAEAKKRGTWVN